MDLSTAVNAVVATLRRRPADLLPFYLLGTAVVVIARVPLLIGAAAAVAYLHVTGRIAAATDALAELDLQPPDQAPVEEDPEAMEAWFEWFESLLPALEPLYSEVAIGLIAIGAVGAAVVSLFAYAAVSAGQMNAVFARLRDERGLVAGVGGVRRHWLSFLGLYLAEFVLWVGVIGLSALVVGLAVAVGGPLVGALVALVVILLAFVVLVAVRVVFAFAPAAVVVEDAGVAGALRGSGRFVRSNPADAAAYLVVAVGVLFGISSAASALTVVGAGTIVALFSAVVAAPALDLLKTVLYGDSHDAVAPPSRPEASLRTQLAAGWDRTKRETVGFVRGTLGLHAAATAVLVGFFVVGWVAVEPLVGVIDSSIEARLADHMPPVAALEFFGNNWSVGIGMSFAGVALVVPTISALAFNGLFLGGIAALEENLAALVAFVVPHGILEIPALIIAGALGFHLGLVAWGTFRGRVSREAFADRLEAAFWVTMGVGAILFVAALIEGFVSPYYWRLFL
ncbi:hypothetical protein JCM17823_13950 [Halorubrum gandharaense]